MFSFTVVLKSIAIVRRTDFTVMTPSAFRLVPYKPRFIVHFYCFGAQNLQGRFEGMKSRQKWRQAAYENEPGSILVSSLSPFLSTFTSPS